MKILSDRMLRIEGSAAHSRCKYVDRLSRSADEQLHNNAPHRKCLRKKTTACVSLFVFFTIRRGTFQYSIEDTTSQTPTTHYTNTCVKLTIVTHLFFSERIAIANPSYIIIPSNTICIISTNTVYTSYCKYLTPASLNVYHFLVPVGILWPSIFMTCYKPPLLRAKRASNLQGAQFFSGEYKKLFPLGCRLRENFIEENLIDQWLQSAWID